ncbi:MAG: ATP-binding protein, partial [Kangiellaceae bacterium]|nr:ATP-binding protein [Kangiellaceae bacterium]
SDFVDIDNRSLLLVADHTLNPEKTLFIFDKQTESVTQLPHLVGQVFAAIYWKGGLWVSSEKLGLIVLDHVTGSIRKIESKQLKAISGFYINGSDELLLSNTQELHLFEGVADDVIKTHCLSCSLSFDEYELNHGQSAQLFNRNAWVFSRDQFFIGSLNKLVSFDLTKFKRSPESISEPTPRVGKLLLTDFKVMNRSVMPANHFKERFQKEKTQPEETGSYQNNQVIPLTESIETISKITLAPETPMFSLYFGRLGFKNRSRIKYVYQMQGLSEEWIEAESSDPKAVFSELNPGNYTFNVKASDSLGNWSGLEAPLSVAIEVLPPWWHTWWAYTLYILFGLGVSALFIRLYVRQKIAESARQSALELTATKEQLFANLSHEFRTPLTLILGPAGSIKRATRDENSSQNEKISQNISLIERNARRLLSMVDQLLSLAKLKEDQSNPVVIQQVQPVCSFALESFSSIAVEKDIEITQQGELESNIWVKATEQALETILFNLLGNAMKYTPQGGRVSLQIECQLQMVEFQVSDTGCGIELEQQALVFERFTRLDAHSSQIPGAGIGLALVKELVTSLGGNISLNSGPGQGSCFKFTLPSASEFEIDEFKNRARTKRLSPNGSDDLSIRTAAIDLIGSFNLETKGSSSIEVFSEPVDNFSQDKSEGRPSLLIVEDNPDLRNFLRRSFEDKYQVFEANDGKQGFDTALSQSPDIIVSDVMMPVLDGFELLEAVRNEMAICHIPVVLLTAKGDKESKLKGISGLADDYITKPFDIDELSQRLENLLGIRSVLQSRFTKNGLNAGLNTDDFRMGSQQESASRKHTESVKLELAPMLGKKTHNGLMLDKDAAFFDRFTQVVSNEYADPELSVSRVSVQLAMSDRQLQRKLKAVIGSSFSDLLREYRLEQSCVLLKASSNSEMQIAVIADKVGFRSSNYFTRCFKARFELTPNEFRKAHGDTCEV